MIRVGVRELKNRLSRYLRLVRQGQTIIVTDRAEVIAEIRSRSDKNETARFEKYAEELELSGQLRRAVNPAISAAHILVEARKLRSVPNWREALNETRTD